MKQTLTSNPSTIASTASKMNVEAFDVSVKAFENKEYLRSFHILSGQPDNYLSENYGCEFSEYAKKPE